MSTSKREFGVFLYELSQKLQREEIDAIRMIEDLPVKMDGKTGLRVLVELQMQEKITASDPSTLQSVFKSINRMDLVTKVKEFVKSQKAKPKKAKKSKSGGPSTKEAEEIFYTLEANLKVSLLQAKVLRDQLSNQAAAAEKCGMTNVLQTTRDAIAAVENEVERRLLCAKNDLEKKYSSSPESSEDDDSPPMTLQRGDKCSDPTPSHQQLVARITRG